MILAAGAVWPNRPLIAIIGTAILASLTLPTGATAGPA